MRSGMRKKTVNLFLIPLLLVPMGIMDWNHFFPLSAQPDLAFQTMGEAIELLVLVGATVLISFGIAKQKEEHKRVWSKVIYEAVIGASFALLLITLSWRDFFPNHRFSLSADSGHLTGALIGGLFFASVGFSLQWVKGNPSKEHEKSVV